MSALRLARAQVLAWRLSAHGLDRRLPAAERERAVHPVGLRTGGGPDAAVLAWHARAEGVRAAELERNLADRRWVDALTVRGTRILDPADLAVLTVGALPPDDAALEARFRRRAAASHGDAGALFRDGVAAARAALAAGPRTQAELSRAVTAALPGHASADCRACRARHVDQGLFRTIGLAVGWVRAHGLDASRFVLPDGWAAGRVDRDAGSAAAALLAWHLRAHSPTTPAELATFLAVGRAEAAMRWLAAPELVEVEHGGGRAWLPAADLDAVRGATLPEGTRLLPPYDALMEVPDRALLVPDPAGRRTVWRTFANPGVALVDGEVSCAWRSSVRAGRLEVRLLPLGGWHPAHRRRLERELVGVAALRGVPPGPVEVT